MYRTLLIAPSKEIRKMMEKIGEQRFSTSVRRV